MGINFEFEIPHVTEYDIGQVWNYLASSRNQAIVSLDEGMAHYATSMRDALDKQQDYYYESQSYLQPLSGTALDIMNRMRIMLGMSPMSGYGTTGAMLGEGSLYGGSPLINSAAKRLLEGRDLLSGYEAEIAGIDEELGSLDKYNLLDSDVRAGLMDQLLQYHKAPGTDQEIADRMKHIYDERFGIEKDNPLYGLTLENARSALQSDLIEPSQTALSEEYLAEYNRLYGPYNQGAQIMYEMASRRDALNQQRAGAQQEVDYYNERIPQLEENLRIVGGDPSKLSEEDQQLLQQLGAQVGGMPGAEPGKDPRLALLEQTPGYRFRYDQGLEALQQAMAAQGLTGSGEALERAQEFGQGLAGGYFDQYMEQLAGLFGQTSGALQAQANLASQQGANEANLLSALAGQQYNVGAAKAGLYSATGTNMANLYSDISKHNASLATSTLNTLINVLGKGTSAANPPGGSSRGAAAYAPEYSPTGGYSRGNYTYFDTNPQKYDWVVPGASEYQRYGGGYI